MDDKCLITGINGFVGKHLSSFLSYKSKEVYGFDRSGSQNNKSKVFQIDILNRNEVFNLIKKIKPNSIFHLAAQSSVKNSWQNPEKTMQVNVLGTKNLLDAVISAGLTKSCRILVVSSAEIYGLPKEIPMKEDHQLNPISPYGKSRLQQEKLIQEYIRKYNLNIIIARSFPHTGPGQSKNFVCSNFAHQISGIDSKQNEPIIRVGNLNAERDFTDVRDIVKAYYLLVHKNLKGTFNVCSGKSIKISEILNKLLKFSNKKITVKKDKLRMRPSDIPVLVGNNSLIKETINWKPKIPIEKTLLDLFNYWRYKSS